VNIPDLAGPDSGEAVLEEVTHRRAEGQILAALDGEVHSSFTA
jgi:hypothetical protein